MKKNVQKMQKKAQEAMPSKYQIESEIKEAEAMGVHKEPIDPLNEACMAEILSDTVDPALFKPTIEEMTR